MSESVIRPRLFTGVAAALTAILVLTATADGQLPLQRVGGPRLKTSLNAYSFHKALTDPLKGGKGMSLFELLDFCAAHNFDAVDPTGYYFPGYPKPPDDVFLNDFKRRAFLLGLDISGTGVRTHFASADKTRRARDVEHVKEWIEVAARMGAPVLRIFAGAHPVGHSWDDVANWMVADLKTCVVHAKKHGILLGIQNHDDFLKTGEQTVKIVKMVDSAWFGVVVDTGAFATPDPYQDIALVAPFAVNWQIKTHMPGKGAKVRTDFKRIVAIARAANYRGYLPIETLPVAGEPYNPLVRVPQALAEWRAALQADSSGGKLTEPIVWNLDNLESIGGHRVTVIGKPRVIQTDRGKAMEFDGRQDGLILDANPLAGLKVFTVEVIFRPAAGGPKAQRFLHFQAKGNEDRLLFETRLTPEGRWFLDTYLQSDQEKQTLYAEKFPHPLDSWHHAAIVVDGKTMRHYVDGKEELAADIRLTRLADGQTSIGVRLNQVFWYQGAIRQIRVTPAVVPAKAFLKP